MELKKHSYHYLMNYMRLFSCICIAIYFIQFVDGSIQIVQERAVLKFMNPKYISDVQIFTVRRRRNEPYKTNISATIHEPWGNNVTFHASYTLHDGNVVEMQNRVCDAVDKPWMVEFIKMYSNLSVCPVQTGRYRYFNIEIPPKNFPMPLPMLKKGDTGKVTAKFFLTATKEKIFDMTCFVRINYEKFGTLDALHPQQKNNFIQIHADGCLVFVLFELAESTLSNGIVLEYLLSACLFRSILKLACLLLANVNSS